MFASAIEEVLLRETGSRSLISEKAGQFLQTKLFQPGNCMSWDQLIEHVVGQPLSGDAWVRQYAQTP